jgi:hypothetical protein
MHSTSSAFCKLQARKVSIEPGHLARTSTRIRHWGSTQTGLWPEEGKK